MSDNFTDLHEVHHIGDMSEHTINGEDISTGIKNSFSESYSTADGGHEWAVKNAQGGEDVYHGTSLVRGRYPLGMAATMFTMLRCTSKGRSFLTCIMDTTYCTEEI